MRHRLAITIVLGALAATVACSRRLAFQGQVLEPPRPALDFTLTDQFGHPWRLLAAHDKVVVLTFLYTTCPDICPLVAAKIHEVTNLLADRRGAVVFVAVTVDPARDTVPVVAEYSRRWEMTDRWRFLTGPQHDLEPIWNYYWVGQVRHELPGRGAAPTAYEIGHSSPVHLLDRAGRIRVVFDADFRPAAMAHDIEALLEQ